MYPKKMWPDTLRVLAYGSIGSSYTAVGTALTVNPRIIKFVNDTTVLLYVSWDGSTNHMYIPGGSFTLLDCTTNRVRDDGFFPPIGTTFYVKYPGSAPGSGNFAIEVYYGPGELQ